LLNPAVLSLLLAGDFNNRIVAMQVQRDLILNLTPKSQITKAIFGGKSVHLGKNFGNMPDL
jgi:hypothetical protein